MKRMLRNWSRALGLMLLTSAVAACTGSTDNRDADTKAVESIVSQFSRFLAAGDTAALGSICARQFILLEDGEFYDVNAMCKSVSTILLTNSMVRQPVEVRMQIRGDAAWCHYRVTGEFRTKEKTMSLALIESMVLERMGKKWQIVQVSTMQAATTKTP